MNPLTLWRTASLLQRIGLSIGIIIALLGAWKLFWWQHDRGVIAEHETKREAAAAPARDTAATERASDAVTNTRNEEQNHAAIKAAPGGALSPAAHALACERLRKLGRIPAACGPASGDGSQTGPK